MTTIWTENNNYDQKHTPKVKASEVNKSTWNSLDVGERNEWIIASAQDQFPDEWEVLGDGYDDWEDLSDEAKNILKKLDNTEIPSSLLGSFGTESKASEVKEEFSEDAYLSLINDSHEVPMDKEVQDRLNFFKGKKGKKKGPGKDGKEKEVTEKK